MNIELLVNNILIYHGLSRAEQVKHIGFAGIAFLSYFREQYALCNPNSSRGVCDLVLRVNSKFMEFYTIVHQHKKVTPDIIFNSDGFLKSLASNEPYAYECYVIHHKLNNRH